ncbi:MAG: GAF domain-containing protein [Anaerolineae bacterium]|nr:GAF domain-containing protein [Anaerolineae bacterium]
MDASPQAAPYPQPSFEPTTWMRMLATIHRSLDPHHVLHTALTCVCQLVNGEFGGVFLFDTHTVTLEHATGLPSALLTQLRQCALAPTILPYRSDPERLFSALQKFVEAILQAQNITALVFIPLATRQSPRGLIFVGTTKSLTSVPAEWLDALGEQIAVALENACLYQPHILAELYQRTQEQSALNAIAEILNRPLEITQSLDFVCQQIATIVGMETVVVHLWDKTTQRLTLFAHYGISPQLLAQIQQLDADDPALSPLIREGHSLAIDDVALFPFPTSFAGPRAEGYRAGIGVPILQRGKPIGTLYVGTKVKSRYHQSDVDLLQNIANQIGVALDNAELYAQMQQRVRELEALTQLGAAIVSNLDARAVAEITADWVYRLFHVDVADLRIWRDGQLELLAQRVARPEMTLEQPFALGDLLPYFLERQEALIVYDILQEPGAPALARELMLPRGLRALIVVPMIARRQMIGTLSVVHSQPRYWLPREYDLLRTMANHVANVLDNAQLYQNAVAEQRKVQAIFDSGLSGLFVTDAQGRVTMFNRAAERITGWTFEEVEGKDWEAYFSDRAADNPVPSLLGQALREKKTLFAFEGRKLRTKDGRIIPVARAAAPLLDEKGNVIGAVGAFWDLSKELRAEIEYKNFLAMIAHQIRTPLTSMLTALELLERRKLSRAHRTIAWKTLKAEGENLRQLANQFLAHQRVMQGASQVQLQPLALLPLVREIVSKFRLRHPEFRFHTRYSDEPIVYADEQYVTHILQNLLDNAVAYSSSHTSIYIRVQPFDSEWIVVAVQDFGVGIPLSEQQYLFQPFYRVPQTSTRRVYGHGLGLSIVKEMVEAMGGKVWVESDAGKGATFSFTLRRAQ